MSVACGHLMYFFVIGLGVYSDPTLDFVAKFGMLAIVAGISLYSGHPTQVLHLIVSIATCLAGLLAGALIGRQIEQLSRKSFLREKILMNSMLAWRAVARRREA